MAAAVTSPLPRRAPLREAYGGPEETLRKMGIKVREGARDPESLKIFQPFAEAIVAKHHPKRDHITRERAAQLFLNYVREHVRYRPDPPLVELVKGAAITLCVPGAEACIPIGDCFPEGTLLLRDDFEFVPVEKVKVGERIWGRDKWTRVEATAFKGRLKVDAVEMNNGSTMHLTPGHFVYAGRCRHGKGSDCPTCPASDRLASFERIRVSDLQEGETLLRPDRIDFGSGEADPDRLYVEGLALADGWVRDNLKCFYVSGRDGMRKEKQKHEVKEICQKLGIETRWHRRYIVVYDEAWATRIAQLGERARFKHAESINLTESSAEPLLRGLMADSTPSASKAPQGARTFSSTSHRMAMQVRVLHRMFGQSMGWKMLTPEQHGGAGKHPIWRLGQRGSGSHREWALAVRGVERATHKAPCWDIQTEDHYVYLPEHDVTVSNCDDLVVAFCVLCMAYGIESQILMQDFGPEHDLHVLAAIKSEKGEWLAADPSHPSLSVGKRVSAIKEFWIDPLDPAQLRIDAPMGEFVGIGSLPDEAALAAYFGGSFSCLTCRYYAWTPEMGPHVDNHHPACPEVQRHERHIGDLPQGPTWDLLAPAADGSFALIAGERYQVVVTTPAEEPAQGASLTWLLNPIAPFLWIGATGGPWTAEDTRTLFASQWFVESVTGSGQTWTVRGVAKANVSLASNTQSGITYMQVLRQSGGDATSPPTVTDVTAPSMSTGTKVFLAATVLAVVAGGTFIAVKRLPAMKRIPERIAKETRKTGRKVKRVVR